MKTKLTIIACLLAGLTFIATGDPSKTSTRKREVVLLEAIPLSRFDPINLTSTMAGYGVQNASSSSNAPVFEVPVFVFGTNNGGQYDRPFVNLAQALADLLDDGYRIEHISGETGQQRSYLLVK